MLPTIRLEHAYRAAGPSPARRVAIPVAPDDDTAVDAYESWYIDSGRTAVAALWTRGELWLGGATIHALGERDEALAPVAGGLHDRGGLVTRWARVTPQPGMRYVIASAARVDLAGAAGLTREALAARLVETPQSQGAAALVLDVTPATAPADLSAWFDALRRDEVDVSWTGNEAGPGLLHMFKGPAHADVAAALLEQARADDVIAGRIGEYVRTWLEDQAGELPESGLLVPDAPERGFWLPVSAEELTRGLCGGTGAWLEPATPRARCAYHRGLPGPSVVAELRRHLDDLTAIGVASQPRADEAVLMFHIIGGRDRHTGAIAGIVLERVWT